MVNSFQVFHSGIKIITLSYIGLLGRILILTRFRLCKTFIVQYIEITLKCAISYNLQFNSCFYRNAILNSPLPMHLGVSTMVWPLKRPKISKGFIVKVTKIALFLATFLSTAAHANICNKFFNSSKVMEAIDNLQASADTDIWYQFNLNDELVILTDIESYPKCALVHLNGKIINEIKLDQELTIANGVFDFFYPYNLPKNELKKIFDDNSRKLGLLVSLHLHDSSGYPPHFTSNIIYHEGFHLFIQMRGLLDQSSNAVWPTWTLSTGSDRDKIAESCYKNLTILDTFNKELQALVDASRLHLLGKKDLSISASKDFIKYRNQRYSQLDKLGVGVPSQGPKTAVSCQDAEAQWEMIEGVANYAGLRFLHTNNKISDSDYIKYAKYVGDDSFYTLGNLQLFLLERYDYNSFLRLQVEISTSPDISKNIFSIFSREINSL